MKKFFAILMTFVLASAFLCGCGSDASGSGGTNGEKIINIGGIGPLTGDYSNYGTSVRDGAKIAVEEINAAGGIAGMKINLMFEDSVGDPESAVSAYGKLMDDGMDVSLGCVFSGETASVMAAAREDDIFLLTPSGSQDSCIATNPNGFRVCFYDSYQGKAAADYIKDNNLASEVGVFYQADLEYSKGLYDAFKEECAKLGINIVCETSFKSDTSSDFSIQIGQLQQSGVKMIFMPIYAAEASTFLKQAKNGTANSDFGTDVYFFGADGLDGIPTKFDANAQYSTNNVLMLTPFAADNKDESVQSFVTKYKNAYNKIPDQFAADGYDAIYIIKQAVENAGITDAKDITAAKLVAQMTSMTFSGITGTMTWNADGNTNKNALAVIYQNGEGSLFLK